ncbi:MAG: UDP-3-O-(3-hydroxymyristoyl)glucosamine N-acyltransferase [Verrucomicrobia bacterium]|nr:UDP-3-O-(3-hydroxymyristoyl)glucosamine N-acyltransferase [Verrucomicrobiota bacterium]
MAQKSFKLDELAQLTSSQLVGDPEFVVTGVNTLEEALPADASFLANPRYREAMKKSAAGVICAEAAETDGKNYLVSSNPSRAFQIIAELLLIQSKHSGFEGIHPTAVIHPSAQIGPGAQIGPYVVIDRDVQIGARVQIGPHASIGFETKIGDDCVIHPSCVIRERCHLGNRVTLQPGAVIGSCGFGYIPDSQGRYIKLEQLGNVILEDDVEIGANTTIDRSRFKHTVVRKGSKIDNLVQIAHNVEVGEHNVIAAQTGIAGSAKTGKHVMLGGQVGILGHVELEDQVMVATRGGVSKSIKTGKYRGSPAIPIAEYNRQEVHVRKLEEYVQRIKDLEKKMEKGC